MRPIYYLLIYVFCIHVIMVLNIIQAGMFVFIPKFEPSYVIAVCGIAAIILNAFVENYFSNRKIEVEDLL